MFFDNMRNYFTGWIMLRNILIFTLFFSLIGCVNLKNEVLIDKVLFIKFGTFMFDGKEYQYMSKGGISFNAWKKLETTITYDSAVLDGKWRYFTALILINENGDIDNVVTYKSSGLLEVDKAVIDHIKKTAIAKKWIVQDKPVNFAVAQRFAIIPY